MVKIRVHGFRYIVATTCAYEVFAILSGKVPTLTEFDRRSKHVVSTIILAGLAVHFYMESQ